MKFPIPKKKVASPGNNAAREPPMAATSRTALIARTLYDVMRSGLESSRPIKLSDDMKIFPVDFLPWMAREIRAKKILTEEVSGRFFRPEERPTIITE